MIFFIFLIFLNQFTLNKDKFKLQIFYYVLFIFKCFFLFFLFFSFFFKKTLLLTNLMYYKYNYGNFVILHGKVANLELSMYYIISTLIKSSVSLYSSELVIEISSLGVCDVKFKFKDFELLSTLIVQEI